MAKVLRVRLEGNGTTRGVAVQPCMSTPTAGLTAPGLAPEGNRGPMIKLCRLEAAGLTEAESGRQCDEQALPVQTTNKNPRASERPSFLRGNSRRRKNP